MLEQREGAGQCSISPEYRRAVVKWRGLSPETRDSLVDPMVPRFNNRSTLSLAAGPVGSRIATRPVDRADGGPEEREAGPDGSSGTALLPRRRPCRRYIQPPVATAAAAPIRVTQNTLTEEQLEKAEQNLQRAATKRTVGLGREINGRQRGADPDETPRDMQTERTRQNRRNCILLPPFTFTTSRSSGPGGERGGTAPPRATRHKSAKKGPVRDPPVASWVLWVLEKPHAHLARVRYASSSNTASVSYLFSLAPFLLAARPARKPMTPRTLP